MFATSNRKTWKQGKNLSARTCSSVATAALSHKSEINWPWSQGQVHTALITQVIQTIPHRPDNTDMMTLIILVTLRVSSWSQEGNKSAEIGSSKVTGADWYHFSRFSAGNFPKIRMLPGGCVSRAHHPFFRRGSGRCWCCPPHFVGAAPHIWATSPKAAPPPTLFNLRSERLSQRLYASSHLPFGKHCSRRPLTSVCCSLKPEASEPFDSLHLFAKLRKPPLAASDVHLSLPD